MFKCLFKNRLPYIYIEKMLYSFEAFGKKVFELKRRGRAMKVLPEKPGQDFPVL